MKVIRINNGFKTKSELDVPAGAVLVIIQNSQLPLNQNITRSKLAVDIVGALYQSEQAFVDQKEPIQNPGFPTRVTAEILISDYESKAAQDWALPIFQASLEALYPAKIEIVEI